MSLTCDTCGSRIKVRIKGGEFLVADGSTLDNINFKDVEDVIQDALGTLDPEKEREDVMLVEVECSMDPEHLIFDTSLTKIKYEIYQRIKWAADRLMQKYYS